MKNVHHFTENQQIKNYMDEKINFLERSSCLSIAFLKSKA